MTIPDCGIYARITRVEASDVLAAVCYWPRTRNAEITRPLHLRQYASDGNTPCAEPPSYVRVISRFHVEAVADTMTHFDENVLRCRVISSVMKNSYILHDL